MTKNCPGAFLSADMPANVGYWNDAFRHKQINFWEANVTHVMPRYTSALHTQTHKRPKTHT